jgi:hypothetical protein
MELFMIRIIKNAEGEGFEPPETVKPQRFSRPPHSTTLPALHLKSITL